MILSDKLEDLIRYRKKQKKFRVRFVKYKTKISLHWMYPMRIGRKKGWVTFRYRYDPVPYVHKRKRGRVFRHPHTLQEKRWNIAHAKEGIRVRGRRTKHNLPDTYDDFYRYGAHWPRNWKDGTKKRRQWV